MRRRALLGAAAATLGAGRVAAQITTLDLRPAPLTLRADDWVAPGHLRQALIRWGDRVSFDAPPWDPRNPTEAGAATQFGWDGRLAGLVEPPLASDGVPRLVLAVAHPQVDPAMAWPGGRDRPAIAAAMQGASILNLERLASGWAVVDGGYQSRRLGADTLCRWTGPAAASEGVQGLLAPQSGCATPWGSLLLAEGDPDPWLARLRGLDARWNDRSRFGCVAELDALDPQSVPAKRTALGRIGAAGLVAVKAEKGRAVVLLADGRPRGFLYRFLSAGPAGPDALDAGTLSVARAEGEALRWLPLPAEGLADPAEAAARLGATIFDTPCALAADPRRPRLLLACRAGTTRSTAEVDRLNPRPGPNPGHVVELTGDPAAERMEARLLFLAGEAGEGGLYGRDQPMSGALPREPATLSVDPRGRLWIGTDRGGRSGQAPDAVFACDLDRPGRGVLLPAYAAPRGAGIGGAIATPQADGLLVMVRTPGAEPGSSFDRPSTRWPSFEPRMPPRSTLLVLSRPGGTVGG